MKKLILIALIAGASFSAFAINCFTMQATREGYYVVSVYTSNAYGDQGMHLNSYLYDLDMALATTNDMVTCCEP